MWQQEKRNVMAARENVAKFGTFILDYFAEEFSSFKFFYLYM